MNLPSRPECQLCDRWAGVAKSVGVPTYHIPTSLAPSPSVPALICIGQNPGFAEDQNNEPFYPATFDGRPNAGMTLRAAMLDGIGASETCSIYLTNCARCGPDPDVTAAQYKSCAPFLLADIHTICRAHHPAPIVLLLLGADAARYTMQHLFNLRGYNLTKAIGENGRTHTLVIPETTSEAGEGGQVCTVIVFTTYHPAHINRKRNKIHPVRDHLRLVANILTGATRPHTPLNLVPVRSPQCPPL